MNGKRIGVFDSGIGGLTSLAAIRHTLPQYDYVYFGDTAHAPYGTRPQQEIYTFTRAAVLTLRDTFHCSLVIVACNTASAEALRNIQLEFAAPESEFRVLGIVVPLIETALKHTQTKHIAVLATPATVASKKYVIECAKRDSAVTVTQVACPLLVPLIERGMSHTTEMHEALTVYTETLPKQVDTVVLGCTHYGHVIEQIRALLPRHITVLSEEAVIGVKTQAYLERHGEIAATLSREGSIEIYATEKTDAFWNIARELTGIEPRLLEGTPATNQ
jgi:glutamate racemase